MSKKSHANSFGGTDYRQGAVERMRESQLLLSNENFAGSIYLAGRGVEAVLRAVIWERDVEIRRGRKSLETGHDLRQLLVLVRKLGLLRPAGREDEFEAAV